MIAEKACRVPTQTRPAADSRWLGPSRGARQQRAGPGRPAELAPAAGRTARTPWCETHGQHVGLPDGQMGNSEVGHMNIGAGRIVYQDLTRIDAAIADGSFFHNAALLQACAAAKSGSGTLHVFGLLSPGGVHSHEDAYFRDARPGGEAGRRAHCRACVSRRSRHAAAKRARVAGETPGQVRGVAECVRRHDQRALLRDGSRQALGARQACLRCDRRSVKLHFMPTARWLRSTRPTRAAKPTNSSSRR